MSQRVVVGDRLIGNETLSLLATEPRLLTLSMFGRKGNEPLSEEIKNKNKNYSIVSETNEQSKARKIEARPNMRRELPQS